MAICAGTQMQAMEKKGTSAAQAASTEQQEESDRKFCDVGELLREWREQDRKEGRLSLDVKRTAQQKLNDEHIIMLRWRMLARCQTRY